MSLVPLFNAIQTQLQTNIGSTYPYTKPANVNEQMGYIRIWNSQIDEWIKDKGNEMYSVPYPCILIEFQHNAFEQLGNGAQVYDDLLIRIHIIDKEIDSPVEGDHEQNLYVYALADAVYAALNFFKPTGAGNFIRINHTPDFHHKNLYHFISEWKTNYIDLSQLAPVNGQTISGGTVTPEITID